VQITPRSSFIFTPQRYRVYQEEIEFHMTNVFQLHQNVTKKCPYSSHFRRYFPVYFALFIFVQSGFEVSNCTPPQAVVRGYSWLCFAASHARRTNLRAYASIGMPLSSQLRFERRYAGIRAGLSRG